MEAKTKDLWVFVETKEDGSAKNVGIELLAPGRDIANKQGGSLVALVVGCGVDSAVEECAAHGADKVVVVDGEEFKDYSTDAYAAALATLIEKYGPASVLIGATPNGRDLGPRVSCRLNTGLTADCTGLDVDEATGCVCWTRPAFGGNLMAVIMCPDHRPQMGTVRPGVFKKPAETEKKAEIIREDFHVPVADIRTRTLEIIREAAGEIVDLEGADIIVHEDAAEFILMHFGKAGRKNISLTREELSDLKCAVTVEKRGSGSVASPRLDSVASLVFNLPRKDAQLRIEKGLVFVNNAPCLKPERQIHEGDRITVRGMGRAQIESFGGTSRKGRIFLDYVRNM